MKGFTKGKGKGKKFIPTTNNKKGLKKSDISDHPRINISYNGKSIKNLDELRNKKSVDKVPVTKIESINFYTAENFDIKYTVDEDGEISYDGDIGKALETMGARKLSIKEIGVLIDDDEDTDVTPSEFYKNNQSAVDDYVGEKTDNHTMNFGSVLADDYGFGTFKVDGRELISVRPQHNDDGEGIYDIGLISDQEGVGKENKSYYALSLFDPRLTIKVNHDGEEYEVTKGNDREGRYAEILQDGSLVDKDIHNAIVGDYDEGLDELIKKFKK